MTVYYTSQGLADIEPGLTDFREGLTFLGVTGAMETEAEEGEDDFTPDQPCEPGYICVTVSADELTGGELNYMLYETTEADWPGQYLGLPTPSWVVTETVPVPDTFPIHIRIPLEGNLFAVGGQEIEGARLGLAVVTGVASIFIVEPDDARGFSDSTLVCQAGVAMNYGEIDLAVPQGDVADLDDGRRFRRSSLQCQGHVDHQVPPQGNAGVLPEGLLHRGRYHDQHPGVGRADCGFQGLLPVRRRSHVPLPVLGPVVIRAALDVKRSLPGRSRR